MYCGEKFEKQSYKVFDCIKEFNTSAAAKRKEGTLLEAPSLIKVQN
jgi:hypothetical protein